MYTFRIYRDASGEWRWRLVARNHRVVADSGEGYGRRTDCARAVRRVRRVSTTVR
jgi:uncharacterized protein